MIEQWLSSPLFGIVLCAACYEAGLWIHRKTRLTLCNPLLLAITLAIAVLCLFRIPLESFNRGGDVISLFLAPATAVLAVSVYSQAAVLKQYFIPVLAGCLAGSVVSMVSAALLCRAFALDKAVAMALLPKSVTTPIAMELSAQHGGLVAVTVAAVIFTGIFGAVLSPLLIRLFHVDNPVAQGVAMGASSHAVGTSRALELGELQGAMSGLSIGVSGILTVLLFALIP